LLLHKVKTGDTLSGIAAQHPGIVSESELINRNKGCDLSKGLRAGDVIIMSIVPSM
jgi:LysM repeat protein